MVYGHGKVWQRIDVEVVARHTLDGFVLPMQVIWADGRRFGVDEVLWQGHVSKSTHTGASAHGYRVMVAGRERGLFRDDGIWFVEACI